MKTLIMLFCVLTITVKAQTVKTETFTVKGNCEECQVRIENAADLKGVKILKWNETTKVATVTYNPEKITLIQIESAIASKGHDAGDVKASSSSYKKLPKCCQYNDAKCEEPAKKK